MAGQGKPKITKEKWAWVILIPSLNSQLRSGKYPKTISETWFSVSQWQKCEVVPE